MAEKGARTEAQHDEVVEVETEADAERSGCLCSWRLV